MSSRFYRTGATLAWRNLRNSPMRAGLITVAMAISIASIGGVRGVAEVARKALQGDSRAWLAADVCVDTRDPIVQEQVDALNRMKSDGSDWTVETIALSMAASDQAADPAFITVKAVDPAVYPYYGALKLDVPGSLSKVLQAGTVAVSRDVLERLDVHSGDQIAIAGQPFRIAALINEEPDRLSGESGIGLRCILARTGYDRTELEASGTSVKRRVLVRLGPGSDLGLARGRLQKIFPGGAVRDYRRVHQRQSAMTESAISFLSVTAFLALALGGIGIAIAMRQHANAELSSFAVLRVLGATGGQMAIVILAETACMMAAALALGVPLGAMVRASILSVASRYLSLSETSGGNLGGVLATSSVALLALAPALAGPARVIRHFRPAIALRYGSGGKQLAPIGSGHRWWPGAFAGVAIAALAYWTLRSWSSALLLVAALAFSAGLAKLLAMALLGKLHRAGTSDRPKGTSFRNGLASLGRPGNYAEMLIVGLATVLTMMIATFEASAAVTRSAFEILPYDRDTLYIAGFRESNSGTVRAFLDHLKGVESVLVMSQLRLELWAVLRPAGSRSAATPALPERNTVDTWSTPVRPILPDGTCEPGYTLEALNGSDVCRLTALVGRIPYAANPPGRDVRSQLLGVTTGSNALSCDQWNEAYARLSGSSQNGHFFPAANRNQTMTVDYYLEQRANAGWDGRSYNVVCASSTRPSRPGTVSAVVDGDTARQIGARPGSRLELESRDRSVEATVAEIRTFTPAERYWSSLQMDCGGLDPSTLFYVAAVRVRPDEVTPVRKAIRSEYPALAVITPEDVEETLSEISNDAMRLVRAVAWYAIGSGLCVLIAVIAASRAARLQEIGVLSALGARRFIMLRIYSVEFATLGLISGLIASALAWGFGSVVLSVVFRRPQVMTEWHATAAAIGAAILVVVAAGWLPTYPLLRRKPMDVLRSE